MAIDFDRFLNWAESRFPTVIVKGDEVRVDSIFEEDHKQHMWCNPYGGKNNRENGVFRCWKTDRRGSLITLVMLRDHCAYEEACEILETGDVNLARMEREVDTFFDEKATIDTPALPAAGLVIPPYSYLIQELSSSNLYRVQSEIYLFERKLDTADLYICTAGEDYKNRIIVPYYDRTGKLIYFNGRYIGASTKVSKYRGPSKECGIGKGDVLYFPSWPTSGNKVYLTEGEFDAMSVIKSGLNAGAFGGKALSEEQATLLRGYSVVLCLDNDPAGKTALPVLGDFLLRQGFTDIGFIRPPKQYKDWNEMLQKTNPRMINLYITHNEKRYDPWAGESLRFKDL